jgi:multiple antibiotic resistance protein
MLLSIGALTLKKTVTLLALVEPASMIPIFLASVEGLEIDEKTRFARTVGISVTLALMVAAFFGMPLFSLLGVSIGAMQVGGGIIVLLLAIAMVLGKETSFKGAPEDTAVLKRRRPSIVPLVIPLLAGPAAFSYVMAHSTLRREADLIHVVLPVVVIGIACWITFHAAAKARSRIRQSTLDIIERIAGFILAAMSIEMIATGLRELFPVLLPLRG